jgi:ComEC/Rec2-related protein
MEERNPFDAAILFVPVLAFLAGIAANNWLTLPFPVILALPVLLLGGYVCLRRQPFAARAGLVSLAFLAGMIHYYEFNQALPANHLIHYMEKYPLAELDKVDLSAVVVTPCVIRRPIKTFPYHSSPNLKTRFWIEAQSLTVFGRPHPVTGLVEVSIPGMIDLYQPGMQIHLRGKISKIEFPPPAISCMKSFAYYKHNRVFARLWVDDPAEITIAARKDFTIPSLIWRVQRWVRYSLLGDGLPVGEYTNDLLSAVVLGDRNTTENELNEAMTRIGATHFLAVSGFNIFVLALGIWWLSNSLGLSRQVAAFLVIVFTILYAIMAGFGPSITRAAIMTLVICGGVLLNRQGLALNSLALAAGIILLVNPNQLFQPGFQLSFIATLGLILLAQPIYLAMFARKPSDNSDCIKPVTSAGLITHWGLDQIKMLAAASLAAFIAAAPLVMIYFNLFSLIAPLGSVLLYLPATLLTFGGFLQLAVSIACPSLHSFISTITDIIGTSFANLAITLNKLPGTAISVPAPAWGLVIAYFFILFSPSVKFRKHLILLIVTIYLSTWIIQSRSGSPWIYAAGPGEGMTTVVNTGQGLALIDCGAGHTGQAEDLIQLLSCNFLAEPRLAILTSSNERYFNDAWSVAAIFPSLEFAVPDLFKKRASEYEPAERFFSDNTLKKRTCSAGSVFSFGEAKFEVLYPPTPEKPSAGLSADSGAVLITLSDLRVLVVTDLSDLACAMVLHNTKDLRADTLIFRGRISENALAMIINQAHIRKIIPQGHFLMNERQKLMQLAKKYEVILPENGFSSGFLVNGF